MISDHILLDNGTYTESALEARRVILEHNFKWINVDLHNVINNHNENDKYNFDIKLYEVESILNKAYEVDKMNGPTVKLLYKPDQQLFLNIINYIWSTGNFPANVD